MPVCAQGDALSAEGGETGRRPLSRCAGGLGPARDRPGRRGSCRTRWRSAPCCSGALRPPTGETLVCVRRAV